MYDLSACCETKRDEEQTVRNQAVLNDLDRREGRRRTHRFSRREVRSFRAASSPRGLLAGGTQEGGASRAARGQVNRRERALYGRREVTEKQSERNGRRELTTGEQGCQPSGRALIELTTWCCQPSLRFLLPSLPTSRPPILLIQLCILGPFLASRSFDPSC